MSTQDTSGDDDNRVLATVRAPGNGQSPRRQTDLTFADEKPSARARSTRRESQERARRATVARAAGMSWLDAAEYAGYKSPQAAIHAVDRFTGGKLPAVPVAQLRDKWRARLELLWELTLDEAKRSGGSARAAVAVVDRAAKLDGLDAPNRVEVDIDFNDLGVQRQLYEFLGVDPRELTANEPEVLEYEVLDEDEDE